MYKETYLSYINAKNNFFQFTDFNFDFQYDFHVKIDKANLNINIFYMYLRKRKYYNPKDFGERILALCM